MENETSASTQDYVLAGGKPAGGDGIVTTGAGTGEQVVNAIVVPPDNNDDHLEVNMLPRTKQGHKCCGGCCDMRRATIIVNVINIVDILMGLWYIAAYAIYKNHGGQAFIDDDEVLEVYSEAGELKGVGLVITIMILRMMANGAGIYGAWIFNINFVGASLAAYCLEVLFAMISLNFAGFMYAGFFAYPHVFFIKEVKAGIMTKENYPIEEQSCCCV